MQSLTDVHLIFPILLVLALILVLVLVIVLPVFASHFFLIAPYPRCDVVMSMFLALMFTSHCLD